MFDCPLFSKICALAFDGFNLALELLERLAIENAVGVGTSYTCIELEGLRGCTGVVEVNFAGGVYTLKCAIFQDKFKCTQLIRKYRE